MKYRWERKDIILDLNKYFSKYILRNIYVYIYVYIVYDEFKYKIKRDLTTQCKSLLYVFVAKHSHFSKESEE